MCAECNKYVHGAYCAGMFSLYSYTHTYATLMAVNTVPTYNTSAARTRRTQAIAGLRVRKQRQNRKPKKTPKISLPKHYIHTNTLRYDRVIKQYQTVYIECVNWFGAH